MNVACGLRGVIMYIVVVSSDVSTAELFTDSKDSRHRR
jgi:hypothetical protein